MNINHVMSHHIDNTELDAFIKHLGQGRQSHVHTVSVNPDDNADVWHYHQPHLEQVLKPNSIVTVHHDLNDNNQELNIDRFLPVYEQAVLVVCINTTQQDLLAEHGISHTMVIPHGHDNRHLPASVKKNDSDKIRLGFITNNKTCRIKGEKFLIEIAKQIDCEKFSFVLGGEKNKRVKNGLTSLGYDVKSFEELPSRIFNELYSQIDLLMMTSPFEAGPKTIPEAIATGTPVIGLKVGLVKDLVTPGINGFWLTGNPDIDSRTINDLASENNRLEKLLSGATEKAHTALTWTTVMNRYAKAYAKVMRA